MRLLYIHYGPQSGVTAAVHEQLRTRGHEIVQFNPVAGFLYKRSIGAHQIPNARPVAVQAVLAAARRFGRHWKSYYLHTTYAFDRLTERAGDAARRCAPDAILQAGVLFGPGRYPEAPYYLYLDHTRAIAERYLRVPALPPPIPFEPAWRARETAVYRGATAIFAMSEHVRASLVGDYGADRDRIHVVGAGPNVEPSDLPEPTTGRQEATFLFVGKAWERKGGPELLDAFAAIRPAHGNAQLWIVGGYRPSTRLPGVTSFGRLGKPELARLYARASAFVLPSLQEPFGLSLLEAMSFGLPCIGTRVEAIPEIVQDGETGLLVPTRDPAAIALAMRALLDDPERARRMGEAGRARAAARFGWARSARRMLDILEEAPRPTPLEAAS